MKDRKRIVRHYYFFGRFGTCSVVYEQEMALNQLFDLLDDENELVSVFLFLKSVLTL